MSALVGRILSRFCESHLKKLSPRTKVVRLSSTANTEQSNLEDRSETCIPASEACKISAALLKEFTNPLTIETVDPPKISREDEVLINVEYCAFNASDALLAKNLYTFKPCLPMVLGYELTGKLIQVGEKAEQEGFHIGDKVIALNKERYGGLADQCVADVSDIWKIPTGMKSTDVIGVLDNYMTALMAFERKVSVTENDMIFINVGISDIGLAAVDLATNVFKAQVICVCGTEDAAALARDKGVLASFKYKDRKLMKELEKLAANKNIKAIFEQDDGKCFKKVVNCFTKIYADGATLKDMLRDDSFAVVVHHLSREVRAIIAGTAAMVTDCDANVEKDDFSVAGFNLREYRKTNPEVYRQAGDDVIEFFLEGLIKPTYGLTVGLCRVNDALDFILNSKCAGKVIVDIKNKDAEPVKK